MGTGYWLLDTMLAQICNPCLLNLTGDNMCRLIHQDFMTESFVLNGTDYKSAPAKLVQHHCELAVCKSAPAYHLKVI